ncbi:MAG: FMN-binding protein [Bacilli bacterium]|nr:FMN-binding protein [Bacilli bacterium]MDD3422874.1 FMN-binding protein [Bacilli bacterium]
MKNPIIKYPLTLGIIGAICAFALAAVHGITAPIISERTAQAALKAIQQIDANAEKVTNVTADYSTYGDYDIDTIYEIETGNKVSAYAYQVSSMGYSADVVMLLVLDASSDTIIGYSTISQAETKGGNFGDTLLSSPLFAKQFAGLSFSGVDSIDYVAGSTAKVTMAAVKSGVNNAINYHVNVVLKGGK